VLAPASSFVLVVVLIKFKEMSQELKNSQNGQIVRFATAVSYVGQPAECFMFLHSKTKKKQKDQRKIFLF